MMKMLKNVRWTVPAAALCLAAGVVSLPATAAIPTAGLVLHLDAAAVELQDGAPLAQWTDLSGSGNHAVQEDETRRPAFVASGSLFGLPVIRFSGLAPLPFLLVEGMGPHEPPNTVFLVWKINQNTGGDQQALDGVTEAERVRIGYQANPSRVFAWSGGGFPNLEKAMTPPFDNLVLTTVVYDPSGGLLRVNGVLEQENPTGDIPIYGFTLGRRVTDTQPLAGDIAEVIVYDRRLSEAEIGEVEAFLDAKWLRDAGDTTPPTIPGNLMVNAGAVFAHLSWDPSTDDSGDVVYEVERDGQVLVSSITLPQYVDRAVLPETSYTYRVRALDLSGNASAFTDAIQTTTTALVERTGLVKAEFYTGISGVLVTNLVTADKFPDQPDVTMFLPSFETPLDWGDNYGVRVTGWFLPPQTGEYVFFIASDDQGHFRLSTDASPENLRLIAEEPVWNPFRAWTGTTRRDVFGDPDNRSDVYWWTEWPPEGAWPAVIQLQAGQRYYFEALMKEGTGGDHLGVTFKLSDEDDPVNGAPTRMTGDVILTVADPNFVGPEIQTDPRSQWAALGQPVSLTVAVTSESSPPLSYQWFHNGEEIPNAREATYTIASFQAEHEGAYSVVVSNLAGTVTSGAAFLRLPGPNPVTEGIVLLLDASALELDDGALIAQWPDLSGMGNHALQPDPSHQPEFVAAGSPLGLPVVRFSAVAPLPSLLIENMGPYAPPNTVFVVWHITRSTGGDQQVLDGITTETRVRVGYQANPSRVFGWSGGDFPNLQKALTVPFENMMLTTALYDTAGGLFRVDGVLEQVNPTGDIPITGFTIGRRPTEAQALAGDVAQVIVYDRRLTAAEIGRVEAYLHLKWLMDLDEDPIPSPPVVLNVAIVAGQLVLSWPASAPGFVPHQTGGLTSPIQWSPVQAPIVEQNGNNTVTIGLTDSEQYFRLVR